MLLVVKMIEMLITSKKQLIKNLDRIEGYLSNGSDELYDAMAQYIARGRVFVSYKVNGENHFAPSRFVGYKDNTLVKHQNNQEQDGKKTTPAISHIDKQTDALKRLKRSLINEVITGQRNVE